jgi:PEGA domain-containing protein
MLFYVRQRAATVWGFLTVVALSGCATITGGSSPQKIKVASNPSGATVIVDGRPCGNTPTIVSLDRKVEHRIQLEKVGYMPAESDLKSRMNPWILGNVVVGGLIGVVVDLATDSERSLSPSKVDVHLAPAEKPTPVTPVPPPV